METILENQKYWMPFLVSCGRLLFVFTHTQLNFASPSTLSFFQYKPMWHIPHAPELGVLAGWDWPLLPRLSCSHGTVRSSPVQYWGWRTKSVTEGRGESCGHMSEAVQWDCEEGVEKYSREVRIWIKGCSSSSIYDQVRPWHIRAAEDALDWGLKYNTMPSKPIPVIKANLKPCSFWGHNSLIFCVSLLAFDVWETPLNV